MDPLFVVETSLGFEQAGSNLEAAVKRHGLGILGIHDIGQTLRSKGMIHPEGMLLALSSDSALQSIATDVE